MLKLYVRVKDTIQNFHVRQDGQDAFEYLLVIGAVMVAVIIAVISGALDTAATDTVAAVKDNILDQLPAVD